jgi:hypothetical protein
VLAQYGLGRDGMVQPNQPYLVCGRNTTEVGDNVRGHERIGHEDPFTAACKVCWDSPIRGAVNQITPGA